MIERHHDQALAVGQLVGGQEGASALPGTGLADQDRVVASNAQPERLESR